MEKMNLIPKSLHVCKKRGYFFFNFKGSVKKIRFVEFPKKSFVANGGPQGIKIDKLFFEKFDKKERVAILWHEFYHCRLGFIGKVLLSEVKYYFLCDKEALWEEEYDADRYSAKENSVKDFLAVLKVNKTLYDKEVVKRNPKTHPPIEKRIEKIKSLEG